MTAALLIDSFCSRPAVCPPDRVLPSPSQDEAALRDGYCRMLTARAITSPSTARELAAVSGVTVGVYLFRSTALPQPAA